MSIQVIILVLMVTSRLTFCSDTVAPLQRNIGGKGQQRIQTTLETNNVSTSTESQGANSRGTKEHSDQSTRKVDNLSSVTPSSTVATATTTKTTTTTTTSKESPSSPKLSPSDEVDAEENKNSNESPQLNLDQEVISQLVPATTGSSAVISSTASPRLGRNSSAPPGRDNKLMSLLAARRSALQKDRWRTHRRGGTTSRNDPETTPKNPTDPRTACERNCTKNFTRRTTASCMRRCASLHKAPLNNTVESSTAAGGSTPAPPARSSSTPSPRTKVDEKDNNEILETDESSHGFFVVTKELNDTANHISAEAKVAPSTEKTHRMKTKQRSPPLSVEEADLAPYTFFGQKLPPNKPTVLRISRVNDEHPRILEVSVSKPPSRNKLRNRYQTRNLVAFSRRYGAAALSKTNPSTTTSTDKAMVTGGFSKDSSEEKLIKAAAQEDNTTVTLLVRSASEDSTNLVNALENTTPLVLNERMQITDTVAPIAEESSVREESTPLLINVPDIEEKQEETSEIPVAETEKNTFPPPSFFQPVPPVEEKPNLIIFLNVTTPKTTPTKSTTPSPFTTGVGIENPSPAIEGNGTPTPQHTPFSTTQRSFTKTTVSSSVRSTVNPLPSVSSSTTSDVLNSLGEFEHNYSFEDPIWNSTTPNILLNLTTLFKGPTIHVSENPEPTVDGVVLENSDVAIEMHRMNLATYVLAGLGMLPIIVIILYVGKTVIFKRRLKDDGDFEHYAPDVQPISPVRKMDQDDRNDQYSITSDQEFERSNLRFKSLLGEGNFGQVWKAEADDLAGHIGTTRIVAVKTVRTGSAQSGLREEAEIMRKLGSHPNVVTLLGACIESEPHLLIMEFAMRGRLLSLLRAARSATNILPASVPGGRSLAPLSPRTLAGFCLDIARGMEYISEKKIVHRDLAARNVLLDHNGVCKICDFGMSIDLEVARKTQPQTRKADIVRHPNGAVENRFKFDFGGRILNHWNHLNNNNNNNNNHNNNNNSCEKKQHDSVSKRPALPIRWMAPEALQYHIFSTETDVWAFGIVLWEIATLGGTPYPNLSGREVVRSVPNGTRPELPQDGRPEFYELMTQCWRKDPRQRPTFREARMDISRTICKWVDDDTAASDYMDVSGFSEDLEHGMVYFNRRISEFECEI